MADEGALERLEKRLAELETRLRHVEAARMKASRECDRLREENRVLRERVKDLTARLQANSSNSSSPPSSDKPWRVRAKWEPSGKPPGGQPGHPGRWRRPFEPKDLDLVVPVLPERCLKCSHPLDGEDVVGSPVLHQVVDLVAGTVAVTQYELARCRCPGCGAVTLATLAREVPRGIVGVRFQAVLALLTGRCRLSRREARETVAALFGPKALVSLGTVVAAERRTSRSLARVHEDALDAVQGAPFVHADETSWRESRKMAWLWSAVTPLLKVFRVDRNRSREAFRRLLFAFEGILITDRWIVYRNHPKEKRQVCWAHLLRNFRALEERGGTAKKIGVEGQKAVEAVFWWWYRFRTEEITRLGLRRGLHSIRERLKWLLGKNLKNKLQPARAISVDLLMHEEALWTFAKVPGIEPTNNAAERSIRKAVLWRKGSFGSASPAGSRYVERMLTVCESLRAQGRSILDFLEQSIRAGLAGSLNRLFSLPASPEPASLVPSLAELRTLLQVDLVDGIRGAIHADDDVGRRPARLLRVVPEPEDVAPWLSREQRHSLLCIAGVRLREPVPRAPSGLLGARIEVEK